MAFDSNILLKTIDSHIKQFTHPKTSNNMNKLLKKVNNDISKINKKSKKSKKPTISKLMNQIDSDLANSEYTDTTEDAIENLRKNYINKKNMKNILKNINKDFKKLNK